MSGGLTLRGEETLVRLASWMPFEQARELFQDLVGVRVSKATPRDAGDRAGSTSGVRGAGGAPQARSASSA